MRLRKQRRGRVAPRRVNSTLVAAFPIASLIMLLSSLPLRGAEDSCDSPGSVPIAATPQVRDMATSLVRSSAALAASKSKTSFSSDERSADAEQVARLQRAIETDQMHLTELQAEWNNPDGQYQKASVEFKEIDEQLAQVKKDIEQFKNQFKSEEIAAMEGQLESVEQKWKLAKGRFDLAIEERMVLASKISTLEDKISKDRMALDKLIGTPKSEAAKDVAAGSAVGSAPGVSVPLAGASASSSAARAEPQAAANAGSAGASAPLAPSVPLLPTAATPPVATSPLGGTSTSIIIDKPPSPEVKKARDDAVVKEAAAQEAHREANSVTSRVQDLRKLIEQERHTLLLARKKVDLASEAERLLEREEERRLSEGASWADLQELRAKMAEAGQTQRVAIAASRETSDRIDELQSQLADLHSQQITALEQAQKRQKEAELARKNLDALQNPLALRNLAAWLVHHGFRIAATTVGMIVLLWLARRLERGLVTLGVESTDRGTVRERENRTRTLVTVFHNAVSVAIVVSSVLMILNELGVNVALLMGGAAVFGLAVAFGAQNLIRDYFSGFVILLENQYKLNDVVRIGTIAGQVERITLRMTVLRDLCGTVHFIPNGQISGVSNMAHGWSRALFEISVSYKEDPDRIMNLLIDLGKAMRDDPDFAPLILEDPTMLGLDSFGESGIVFKFFIKTRPLQQWTVKRELHRRIKKKFDELRIEIPYPHRTIYMRSSGDESRIDPIESLARRAA